ncbi:hypothetical protein CYMTET_41315 [Cymbomonas tetramitiformis]|uniref:Uncharacterized protein n=1 Tax=Cymbomonas tetramitiformis TaxID=36881 RepID=A0AAE0C739_9CHLO|nr:hypothetical protein CYMTET_44658 [Cymbomonas tetramitiformis]KAK3248884.1 hypothetical protein CYMTET_41670 [Cymbomonas tetramitiformis]KAK3249239.1 hypothetical protein CYMTET_41315 [Cymbomonas tetramitiformis]|eukprot:gene33447-42928_t
MEVCARGVSVTLNPERSTVKYKQEVDTLFDLKQGLESLWNRIVDDGLGMWLDSDCKEGDSIQGWVLGVERHMEDMILEVSVKSIPTPLLVYTPKSLNQWTSIFIRITFFPEIGSNLPGIMLLPRKFLNDKSSKGIADINKEAIKYIQPVNVNVYAYPDHAYSFTNLFHSDSHEAERIQATTMYRRRESLMRVGAYDADREDEVDPQFFEWVNLKRMWELAKAVLQTSVLVDAARANKVHE